MVIFCRECRGRLARVGNEWKHEKASPKVDHKAEPLAARRCPLFDPGVVGLPGYDRTIAWLVRAEKAGKTPIEAWRIGLYVFDGRVRGVFKFLGDASKKRPRSLFQPPEQADSGFLRNHPLVKERLAAISPARKKAVPARRPVLAAG
jgi:hypothetical protein